MPGTVLPLRRAAVYRDLQAGPSIRAGLGPDGSAVQAAALARISARVGVSGSFLDHVRPPRYVTIPL
jgi:hypothetical protein